MAYQGAVHRSDVFLADLEPTVGTELRKTRPVVVISNDAYNRHFQDVTAIPVQPFQIRVLSKMRLLRKSGVVASGDHRRALEDELLLHLGIELEEG